MRLAPRENTPVDMAKQYKVHPIQIGRWRMELLERAAAMSWVVARTPGAAVGSGAFDGLLPADLRPAIRANHCGEMARPRAT